MTDEAAKGRKGKALSPWSKRPHVNTPANRQRMRQWARVKQRKPDITLL